MITPRSRALLILLFLLVSFAIVMLFTGPTSEFIYVDF